MHDDEIFKITLRNYVLVRETVRGQVTIISSGSNVDKDALYDWADKGGLLKGLAFPVTDGLYFVHKDHFGGEQ